ncbi:MAG: ABC transporter permease [Clostridiales bacterium]
MKESINNIFKNNLLVTYRKLSAIREMTVLISIIFISIILAIASPHFITKDNLISTTIGLSSDVIIVIGVTIVLISGGLDLSVGSIMSLSGITCGMLYLYGVNIWIACIISILIGTSFGFINGYFIGKIGLNPFITTLAIAGISRGLSYILTEGSPISLYGVPKSFSNISQSRIGEVPIVILVIFLVTLICDYLLRRSDFFRKVFYLGSNEKAALLSGINIKKIKIIVYVSCALFAALAGVLSTARFTVVTPSAGIGAEMRSISAAVIGGASLSGGEGTIIGAVLGVILLNIINNGLILLNVPVYWQDFVNGAILLLAVTIDFVNQKKRKELH